MQGYFLFHEVGRCLPWKIILQRLLKLIGPENYLRTIQGSDIPLIYLNTKANTLGQTKVLFCLNQTSCLAIGMKY